MSQLLKTKNFNEIYERVSALMKLERTEHISRGERYPVLSDYSECGLKMAGRKFGFPSDYVRKIRENHTELAEQIVDVSTSDYYKDNPSAMFRSFGNGIDAVLSSKYNIFDDNEVMDILSENAYLMGAGEFWYHISPECTHIRFISETPFYIPNDNSELHIAVFVDNSMVGSGSFKVRFGIYRSACTNGMIWGLKQFTILRETHLGNKPIADILHSALKDVHRYEEILMNRVTEMANTNSHISRLSAEDAITYLKGVLLIGEKKASEVIELYKDYGGQTRWDLCNAITDYAHSFDLNERLRLESIALKVA